MCPKRQLSLLFNFACKTNTGVVTVEDGSLTRFASTHSKMSSTYLKMRRISNGNFSQHVSRQSSVTKSDNGGEAELPIGNHWECVKNFPSYWKKDDFAEVLITSLKVSKSKVVCGSSSETYESFEMIRELQLDH